MITTIQSQTTQTGPFTGSGVDISAITKDWTIVLELLDLEPFSVCRFVFEDSTDGFSSDILAGPSFSMLGPSSGQPTDVYSLKKSDFPDLRFGVASASLRLALTALSGAVGLTVTYRAWFEA